MVGVSEALTGWPIAPAVDMSPKPIDHLRLVARWTGIIVQLATALRWPLAVLLVPVFVIGPIFGAIVAVVVGGVGFWRSGFVRNRFIVGVLAARVVVFRSIVWPALCANQMIVETASRRARIAKLVAVEFGPGVWWRPSFITCTIKPLAKHPQPQWVGYEPRVRSFLNYRGSTWQVDPDNPNHILVTVRRAALPAMWVLGDQVPTDLLAPPTRTASDTEFVRDEVYLGVGADDLPIVWYPDEPGRSSLFITGRTGGGKGLLAKTLLVYGIRAGWRIRVVNPKSTGEFQWAAGFIDHASANVDTALMYRMIGEFRAEMERRVGVLKSRGVASWEELPVTVLRDYDMAHRDVLLIDELANLMLTKGQVVVAPPAGSKGRPVDLFPMMVADVTGIVSMGRAVGCSLVTMTQHPITETMGPLGSTLKANLGARIAVGFIEPEAAGGLFGKTNGEQVAALLRGGTSGRAVVQGLANRDRSGWRDGQMTFATPTQLAALIEGVECVHAVRDYDNNNNSSSSSSSNSSSSNSNGERDVA